MESEPFHPKESVGKHLGKEISDEPAEKSAAPFFEMSFEEGFFPRICRRSAHLFGDGVVHDRFGLSHRFLLCEDASGLWSLGRPDLSDGSHWCRFGGFSVGCRFGPLGPVALSVGWLGKGAGARELARFGLDLTACWFGTGREGKGYSGCLPMHGLWSAHPGCFRGFSQWRCSMRLLQRLVQCPPAVSGGDLRRDGPQPSETMSAQIKSGSPVMRTLS